MTKKKALGQLLIEAAVISQEQLEEALAIQQESEKRLGEVLLELEFVSERQIFEVLEYQLKIPFVDLNKYEIDPECPMLISEALARKHVLLPVKKENNQLIVAMIDPLNLQAFDDVSIFTGLQIKPLLALRQDILSSIDDYYSKEDAAKAVEDFKKEIDFSEIAESDSEGISDVSTAPVVRLVNSVLQHAVRSRASDIHIEPFDSYLRIRFRVDGELLEIMKSAKAAHAAIVTRIKIMGRMDIAEKRVPQDGRVEMSLDGKDIDLRISILPTVYGEKIVIRLLGRSDLVMTKEELGFSETNIVLFDSIIKSSNGIVLVTGPTGSGKTTTLYAVLRELNKINKNIITVEDPVEYRLEGVNQVQVNTKAGLTFANGLRSILRQDPDIIMIGEIRDSETAQIAVRAAITGHLVLSTMHTNDAASTVTRIVDMGIEPYLVSSSVVGVTAQRLLRRICSECKTAYKSTPAEMKILKLREAITLFKGEGCSNCNHTGYRGRIAIHEVMPITSEIRDLIDKRASLDLLRKVAGKQGTTTLRDNSVELVQTGITTVDELLKVTYSIE